MPNKRLTFIDLFAGIGGFHYAFIIGKTNRDEIQNQMRQKFTRKLQKRNVIGKTHTSYSQKRLSNVN